MPLIQYDKTYHPRDARYRAPRVIAIRHSYGLQWNLVFPPREFHYLFETKRFVNMFYNTDTKEIIIRRSMVRGSMTLTVQTGKTIPFSGFYSKFGLQIIDKCLAVYKVQKNGDIVFSIKNLIKPGLHYDMDKVPKLKRLDLQPKSNAGAGVETNPGVVSPTTIDQMKGKVA